jgi:LysM repeat protein
MGGVVMTACGGNEIPTDGATLAPIQTTVAVTVTVVSATTLPQYYRVQRGNTLTEIAASYGIPVAAIMQLNGLTNADDIFAGQILAIPPRDIVASVLPPTVPGQTAPTVAPTVPAAPAATSTTTVA